MLTRRGVITGAAASATAGLLGAMPASATLRNSDVQPDPTYDPSEIVDAGHQAFGGVSQGLAGVVEHLFRSMGRPNGYIVGQEGSGAIFAGLRYGEGRLQTRNAGEHLVFWQGPTIGFDVGGDGARVLMLAYHLPSVDALYQRFGGINGQAYAVAGVGVSVYAANDVFLAPIRSGIGARLGANIGYLNVTRQPTWNPF
ncbi:MAG: DUF1134 domain-containing protein [Pseudomonadota bacterium]